MTAMDGVVTEDGRRHAMHQAARWYVGLGLTVIPLRRGTKKPIGDGWEKPDTGHWTTDEVTCDRRWLGDFGGSGIGLMCDPLTRTIVLDVDVKNGATGMMDFAQIQSKYGVMPTTLRNFSVSGGYHLIYRVPEMWAPSTMDEKRARIGDVELLFGRRQAVMAPTALEDGRAYSLEKHAGRPAAVAELPGKLLDLLLYDREVKRSERSEEAEFTDLRLQGDELVETATTIIDVFSRMDHDAFGSSIVDRAVNEILGAGPGTRYATLKSQAKHVVWAIANDGAQINLGKAVNQIRKAYAHCQNATGEWSDGEAGNCDNTIYWAVADDPELLEAAKLEVGRLAWLKGRGVDVGNLDERQDDDWDHGLPEPSKTRRRPQKVRTRVTLGGGRSAADRAKNADTP